MSEVMKEELMAAHFGSERAVAPRTVTLRDVAREAGVSVSTASRVLDDRGRRSGSPNAERVRDAAAKLGYRRNANAAGLRLGATSTIGMLVPSVSDTVMAKMFEAVEKAARAQGMIAVVATCGNNPDDEAAAIGGLLERNVDGLVLATARYGDQLPAQLRDRGIPHVLVLRTDNHSDSSLGDDELGGYLAVRHLLDLGHERIAVVTGPSFTSTARQRATGARRAFSEYGINDVDNAIFHAPGYRVDDGLEQGERLFAGEDPPSAVFAANDDLAIGIMSAAYRHGIEPGRDLAIVGYNDTPLARRMPVPLTSVRTAFDRIAECAFQLLSTQAESSQPRILTTPPTLIPRASSGRNLRTSGNTGH